MKVVVLVYGTGAKTFRDRLAGKMQYIQFYGAQSSKSTKNSRHRSLNMIRPCSQWRRFK